MAYLKIKIDVQNAEEVITEHKGQLMGLVSKLFSDEKKKSLIHERLYEILRDKVHDGILKGFEEEGIKANVTVTIEEKKESNKVEEEA